MYVKLQCRRRKSANSHHASLWRQLCRVWINTDPVLTPEVQNTRWTLLTMCCHSIPLEMTCLTDMSETTVTQSREDQTGAPNGAAADHGRRYRMQPSNQEDTGLTLVLHQQRAADRCTPSWWLSLYCETDDMQTVSMASSRFRPERSAVVSEQFSPTA